MAVKRIRSKELEIAEKNNKTLEEVCMKYGVFPDEGLEGDEAFKSLKENMKSFCVTRGITEEAALYFIGEFADNSKKAKRKNSRKKKEKSEENENLEVAAEENNQENTESPESILENLKKDLESMTLENCQEIVDNIQTVLLDFEIKLEECQTQQEHIKAEADAVKDEINVLEEQLATKKNAYDDLNFNVEVLQETINSNNELINQFKELVELSEQKKSMLNPDLLLIDSNFDASSIPHGKEVTFDDFEYSDEDYTEKISEIMQLTGFDDLSMKQIKMYAKILVVLAIYDNNENGKHIVLGINEEDRKNIMKIQDTLVHVNAA